MYLLHIHKRTQTLRVLYFSSHRFQTFRNVTQIPDTKHEQIRSPATEIYVVLIFRRRLTQTSYSINTHVSLVKTFMLNLTDDFKRVKLQKVTQRWGKRDSLRFNGLRPDYSLLNCNRNTSVYVTLLVSIST